LLLLLLFVRVDAKILIQSEARHYDEVYWYHFPKTGGTTMRSLLYRVCVREDFNLTAAYGLTDECSVPFSCHKGRGVRITYGHLRDGYVSPPSNRVLRVIMLREPVGWLASRAQHETRKTGRSGGSLAAQAVAHGGKYFNFLRDDLRLQAMRWFNRLIKSVDDGSAARDMVDFLDTVERHFKEETLVLLTERFEDSLLLLTEAFGTSFYSEEYVQHQGRKGVQRLNGAFDSQENASAGSLSELKRAAILLEVHSAIYSLALREFFRQRQKMLTSLR